MTKYNDTLNFFKGINRSLNEDDIKKAIEEVGQKKDYSLDDFNAISKCLQAVSLKKNYVTQKEKTGCRLGKQNGRVGVSFDDYCDWLEDIGVDQGINVDREKVRKILARREYDALRIAEGFFNPVIRSFASQIIREQK